MLEVLEFIFRDFWTWLGTLCLIGAFGYALSGFKLFTIHIGKKDKNGKE